MNPTPAKTYNKIPGGLCKDCKPEDFDPEELAMGIKVELEHTDDHDMATEIAMDHLTEFPDYYTRLKKVEDSQSQVAGQLVQALLD